MTGMEVDKDAQRLIAWGVLWFLVFSGVGTCNYMASDAKWQIDTDPCPSATATPAPGRHE